MIRADLTVVSNDQLSRNSWRLTLEGPTQLISGIRPGQFINIKIIQSNDPLFRRPFSVFRCSKKDREHSILQVVYEVVGRGTEIMSRLEAGDRLDAIGPLGNGFERVRDKKTHLVIAGGIGSAGIFMLCEELSVATSRDRIELYVILDVRTKDLLILEEEFRTLQGNVLVATHDGSLGYKGYVTDMIMDYIESNKLPCDCAVYACGPEKMYRDLVPVCQEYHIPAQISIERNMMCGMGACMSCVCKINKKNILKRRELKASHVVIDDEREFGYALVCRDGPVFHIDEVIFDEN